MCSNSDKYVKEGGGKGMKVPCHLFFTGETRFIDILKNVLPKNLNTYLRGTNFHEFRDICKT